MKLFRIIFDEVRDVALFRGDFLDKMFSALMNFMLLCFVVMFALYHIML